MTDATPTKPVRHLLGLSGGKDSSALAIYMRDKVPEMEYFFADTGAELPETLEYIDVLEDYLGKKITRLNAAKSFDWYLQYHGNFLPSARQRWCTVNLKLIPFEEFVGSDQAVSYIAIRADEPTRSGYSSKRKPNISTRMPFREDGLGKDEVMSILAEAGIGLPKYYSWRSRSGCYFCFFQQQEEWAGLKKHHPDLFKNAKAYEFEDKDTGRLFTWNQAGPLDEVVQRAEESETKPKKVWRPKKLIDAFSSGEGDVCLECTK